MLRSDYGSAISLTFTVEPKATRRLPWPSCWIFPSRSTLTARRSSANTSRTSRTRNRGRWIWPSSPWRSYPQWWDRTVTIQKRIFDSIQSSPSYKGDRAGALRLTRLILNELHFPLSNAIVWVEDEKGNERARFLECFDYAYIDPSDVDWYSMVLLMLFPRVEKDLCQGFIDSILAEDPDAALLPPSRLVRRSAKALRGTSRGIRRRIADANPRRIQDQGQRGARPGRDAQGPSAPQRQRLRLVQQQLLGGPVPETDDARVAQREVHRRHRFPEEELGDAQVRPGCAAQARFRRRRHPRRLSRGREEHLRQPGALRRRRLRRHAIPRRLPGHDQDGADARRQGRRGAHQAGLRQGLEQPRATVARRRRTRRARSSNTTSPVSIPRPETKTPMSGPTSSTRCGI